jgi:hypothetical protein
MQEHTHTHTFNTYCFSTWTVVTPTRLNASDLFWIVDISRWGIAHTLIRNVQYFDGICISAAGVPHFVFSFSDACTMHDSGFTSASVLYWWAAFRDYPFQYVNSINVEQCKNVRFSLQGRRFVLIEAVCSVGTAYYRCTVNFMHVHSHTNDFTDVSRQKVNW